MNRFIFSNVIFALICMSAIYFSSLKWSSPLVFEGVPLLFLLLNILLYKWVKAAVVKSPAKFVNAFMTAITLKLLFTASVVAVLIVLFPESKAVLALGTFFIYLGATFLFSRALLKIK
jgi:hypothetical protein